MEIDRMIGRTGGVEFIKLRLHHDLGICASRKALGMTHACMYLFPFLPICGCKA